MRTICRRWCATLAAALGAMAVTGCQSVPPVPEHQYYRLLAAPPATAAPYPLLPTALVVRPLRTEGLYSERAMIFSDLGQRRLQQYRYHHWLYPPGQLVQEHLAARLRQAGVAPAVRLQDYAGDAPYAVSGRVVRFEEDRSSGRPQAEVALELRLEKQGRLLWQHAYQANEPVAEVTSNGLASAMEVALDEIYKAFLGDLRRIPLE